MQAEVKDACWALFDTEDLKTRDLLPHPGLGRAGPRASRGWRGLTMTSDGLRLLQDLRRSLHITRKPRQT